MSWHYPKRGARSAARGIKLYKSAEKGEAGWGRRFVDSVSGFIAISVAFRSPPGDLLRRACFFAARAHSTRLAGGAGLPTVDIWRD